MKAIILARVSSKEQQENNSIPAQLRSMYDYCDRREIIDREIFEIVESSTKKYRKQFNECVIDKVKKSKEKMAIIVDTVDRLQRGFKESVELDEFIKEDKIEIHFIRENLVIHKNSNSADLMRWDMAVMFARNFVLQLSDNVKRGMNEKFEEGGICGKAPIGYLNVIDPDNIGKTKNGRPIMTVIIDEKRAPFINQAFELYSTGQYSYRAITKFLEKEGLRGVRSSKPLVKTQMERMLKDSFYYGVMKRAGKTSPHKYGNLISYELFDKCQKIREKRNKQITKTLVKEFIFNGLITCDNCGCTVSPEEHIKKNGKRYVYYSCTNGKGNCKKKYINENKVVEKVELILEKLELTDIQLEDLSKKLEKDAQNCNLYLKNKYENLTKEQKQLEERREALMEWKLDEDISGKDKSITRAMYDKKFKEITERETEVSQELLDCNYDENDYLITKKMVLKLASHAKEIFNGSEVKQKRQLSNYLFQNCKANNGNIKWELSVPFNMIVNYTNCPNRCG